MKERYKALVVGTGFGGSVTACRLAQALGDGVGVLERGKDYRSGKFPRDWTPPYTGWLWEVGRGLFDVKALGGACVVRAAGLGGGSLVYANVQMRAPADVFEHGWPAGYSRAALDPYYDLVAHMLSIRPFPHGPGDAMPPKTRLVEQAARDLGRERQFFYPNLAITFADTTNPFGVAQPACTHCGECDIGCQVGAKNTLDKNYLVEAVRRGAEIGTECEVKRIEPTETGYRVHYTDHRGELLGRERTIDTDHLFLCAGALGSTELLLRSRDDHRSLPELSPMLGRRYSTNGDFLTLVREDGEKPFEPANGPTVTTTLLADRGQGDDRTWYMLQEGGYPKVLMGLLRLATRAPADSDADDAGMLLLMGRDRADGRLELVPIIHTLRVVWDSASNMPLYQAEIALAKDVADKIGGELVVPPNWTYLRQPFSTHNLGGCVMSDDPDTGVTNGWGEVHGHPDLYVIDGAAIPGSLGANPSHTIAAVAERNVEAAIRKITGESEWRAPDWQSVCPVHEPLDDAYVPPGGTPPPSSMAEG
jgi:cholesterol oxidase